MMVWVEVMGAQRAHIVLPETLIRSIDSLVGPRGRSAFLVESAEAEVQRRQLLQFLQSETPVWTDEAHPELAEGTAAWVRSLRKEGSHRIPETPVENAGE